MTQIHGKVYTKQSGKSRKAELCVHIDGSLKSLFTFEKGGEGLWETSVGTVFCVEGLGM